MLMYICLTPTNNIWFWQNSTSRQQCIIYCQSKSQISVQSADANDSYSTFVRSPQNTSISSLCGRRQIQKPETEGFWCDLTKTVVIIVGFGRFNWLMVFWLITDGALFPSYFVRIRCDLSELRLRKCTVTAGFTYETPICGRPHARRHQTPIL